MAFIVGVVLVYDYLNFREQVIISAKNEAFQKTIELAAKIDDKLSQFVPVATALSKTLHDTPLSESDLIHSLKQALNANSDILGIGVAFEPFSFDPDVRLFAPYFIRQDEALKRVQIENQIDYTVNEYEWYHNPLQNGAGWSEPYFNPVAEKLVVEYAVPFLKKDPSTAQERKMGVVFVHYALQDILDQINTINMGKMGYAIMLSQNGTFVSHPVKEYVEEGKTASILLEKTHNLLLEGIMQKNILKENATLEGVSDVTAQPSWVNLQHIPTTEWTLALVYSKADLTQGSRPIHRRLIWIMVTFIFFILMLIVMDLSREKKHSSLTLWLHAFFASLLFTFGIGLIWFLTNDDLAWKNLEGTIIIDRAGIESFKIETIRTALRERHPLPIYVPTGIFVQSIEFTNANNVTLTGYIWQKYNKHVPDDLSRGFVLPEAQSAEIIESYRRNEKDGEVIGWHFHVTLRQDFDYTRYPFDQQAAWIRLWHKDFDKNVVLLPALDSYDMTHPERLPGIEQDFVLPGWKLSSSFFNYRYNSYNTNFGFPFSVGQNKFPELYFQIGVKRRFLNPFISNLTPIIVVLLMLFAVLITSSKESGKIQLLGFSASSILASSSALFFVVLISHIDLRNTLSANKIFYMEYFYVVTYAAILAISINSILFSWGINVSFVQYRDNLLPKLFYWPIITLMMFLVTLVKFY